LNYKSTGNLSVMNGNVSTGDKTKSDAKVGGSIFWNSSSADSGSGTDLQLATFNLPANTLGSNGESLQIISNGQVGGGVGTMDMTLKMGTCTIFDTPGFTSSLSGYKLQADILRINSSTIQGSTSLVYGEVAGFPEVYYFECGQTFSSATLFNLTGSGAAGSSVIFKNWKWWYSP